MPMPKITTVMTQMDIPLEASRSFSHPKNTAEGLQTVTAFGLLADVYTGYPVLLTEMTVATPGLRDRSSSETSRESAIMLMPSSALPRPIAETLKHLSLSVALAR